MAYEVVLSPQAVRDLSALNARVRSEVRDHIEAHLTHEPSKTSRSRIKRLRGLAQPQFRLRVGNVRVFYDIVESRVHVLTIVTKEQAQQWLSAFGVQR